MTPDQLADRIMRRIEDDKAIHKSSIVEELTLACASASGPRQQINDHLTEYLATRYGLTDTWFKERSK
jgi:hypothetical protein